MNLSSIAFFHIKRLFAHKHKKIVKMFYFMREWYIYINMIPSCGHTAVAS